MNIKEKPLLRSFERLINQNVFEDERRSRNFLKFMATMSTFGCVVLLCLCCMESRRVNNNHPTQPPRRFHELIQDIKPTIKYKPRAPPPIPVVTFNSRNFKNVPSALFASPS